MFLRCYSIQFLRASKTSISWEQFDLISIQACQITCVSPLVQVRPGQDGQRSKQLEDNVSYIEEILIE